jgi:nitrate/nitrite-specific signal transduction histidine kinase
MNSEQGVATPCSKEKKSMKIKTKLRLNTWISAGMFIIMFAVVVWSFFNSSRIYRDLELIDELRQVAAERVMLRDDYLLHREERAKIQWQAKSETLRGLLDTADTRFTQREEKTLLTEARKAFEATFTSFSKFLEKHQRREHAADKTLNFTDAETRLINQVFLKAYVLSDNIMQLHRTTQNKAKTAREGRVLFVAIFVMGCVLVVIFNTTFINFLLRRKIAALASGMDIIGNGNLDYRIEVEGKDELSNLARAGNDMADRLKKSHTSVENLQKEIAERQRAEEKLSRTNRVLAVISQINQTVVRTREQNILFAEVCRIAVEFGKFRMAWVGLIDEQNKMIKPVVWNGFEEGYLTKIKKFYAKDNPEGYGPTERAIRDGKYFYCNDIANDPLMAPWREEALQRGYRSSIALPISLQNTVIGAFTIYADDPFIFNATEINLLKEVIGDINYALEKMESEKKQRQGEDKINRLNENLERRVLERTAELSAKTIELERVNKVFVDRELRMRELKARIAELEKKT